MRKLLLLILSFWISLSLAQDPVLEKHWWVPNGKVTVIEHDTLSNQVYLGGEFTNVAAKTNGTVFLERLTGHPDLRFPEVNGVSASIPDGSGGWYIGGSFSKVGDSLRNRIAHINSTGKVSSKFSGVGLNGNILDMALSNDTLFVTGSFTGVGNRINAIGIADKINDDISSGFPVIDGGNISEIIRDNNGGWFVSGDFDKVGDSIRSGLVQINSNYQVTAWNPELDGSVISMELSSGILYVGGYISGIKGQTRNNLAAIDAISGMPTSFAPVVNSAVYNIAISNNALYLIGDFGNVNGASNPIFACVDKITGVTIPENLFFINNFINSKCDMLVHGDTLFVGGYFNTGFQNNLFAISTVSNTQLNWYPIVDSTVCALEWYNGSLIAGGDMSQGVCKIDPVTGNVTSVYNLQGRAWSLHIAGDTLYIGGFHYSPGHCVSATNLVTNQPVAWDPIFTGVANAISSDNNNVIVGGSNLEAFEGTNRYMLASFDAATGNLTQWNPPKLSNGLYPSNSVFPLFAFGDKIYVGGDFHIFGDSIRHNIVELDRYQGNVTSWQGPLINSSSVGVYDLYVNDNNIFAGGNFSYQQNGINKQDLIILNRNSGNIEPWSISANDYGVNKIHPVGELLFVAGNFDTIAGQNIPYIAAFEAATGILHPINIDANKAVYEISNFGNTLYLGGTFDSINGIVRNGLCAYDIVADVIDPWDPDAVDHYNIYHLNSDAYRLVVSGGFSSIGGIKRKNFVALDGLTGKPTSLAPDPDDEVTCIAYTNDAVYIGGIFDTIAGVSRNFLAGFDKSTFAITNWDPSFVSGFASVKDLLVEDQKLYIGGGFSSISGQTRRGIAAYDLPGHTLNALNTFVYGTVYDIEKRNDTLYIGGSINAGPGGERDVLSLNLSSGLWNQLSDTLYMDDNVYSIALAANQVLVGGEFDNAGSIPRRKLAAFDINPPGLSSWDPFETPFTSGSLAVRAFAVYDSTVFVGGDFSFPGNTVNEPRYKFAAIGLGSGLITPWNPNFGNINDLEVSGSKLFVGSSGFYVLSLEPLPEIQQLPDVIICSSDTIGPLSFNITDPVDVNTVQLTAYSSDTNVISANNIFISGIGANRSVTIVPNAGTFGIVTITIVAINQDGATSHMYFNIHQVQSQVQINGSTSVCAGDTVTLDAGIGYTSYSWNTGESTSSIQVTQGGIYSVLVNDANGCTAYDSLTVTLNPLPVVAITATPGINICLGDSTLLSATPGYPGYQWLKNNIVIPGATTNSHYAKFTSGYRCTVTDSNSCSKTSSNVRVRIVCFPPDPNEEKIIGNESELNLEVSIQPNPSSGDFTIVTNCNGDKLFSVEVYDASQRLVREGKSDLNSNTFIISKLPAGTYYAKVKCGDAQKQLKLVQVE